MCAIAFLASKVSGIWQLKIVKLLCAVDILSDSFFGIHQNCQQCFSKGGQSLATFIGIPWPKKCALIVHQSRCIARVRAYETYLESRQDKMVFCGRQAQTIRFSCLLLIALFARQSNCLLSVSTAFFVGLPSFFSN